MIPKTQGKYIGTCVAMGLIIGVTFGVIYGSMMEDVGFWIAIGAGLGLSFGAAIGTRLDANAKKGLAV